MKTRLKYGIALALGLLMFWAVLRTEDFALFREAGNKAAQYMCLCDACFVPGIFLGLAGVLTWLSTRGAFDTLSYMGRAALHLLLPKRMGKLESLYDYREEKASHRGRTQLFLLWTGLLFLAAALIFLLLFTRAEAAGA